MRKYVWVFVLLVLPFFRIGVLSAPEEKNWRVVLRLPEMEKVEVKSVIFKSVDDTRLRMNVYYPPGIDPQRPLPAVILHNAMSLETADMEGYRDWGRLFAASGLIAVGHQSRFFQKEDTEDLIAYIRSHAEGLRIDADRLGLWTASGNTLIGFPLVMDRGCDDFRCAAFYYGMPDPETVDKHRPLRQDLPLLIVRCGLDEFRAGRNIDFFIAEALKADLDMEFVNYLRGHHAFDIVDASERSREIIRRTVAFFKRHLIEEKEPDQGPIFTSMRFHSLMKSGRLEEGESLFCRKLAEREADGSKNPFFHREIWERGMVLTGRRLLQEGKKDAAILVFRWMLEAHPESPTAHLSAAEGFHSCGDRPLAIETARKALRLSQAYSGMNEDQRRAFRESVEERLKKWNPQA
ncbi:MAG: hypothetical protein OEW18_00515 [Candidatus Aminicenantes bacterium]|nr:hypothetical protein [Candidatus Aminicenantes bacterium]